VELSEMDTTLGLILRSKIGDANKLVEELNKNPDFQVIYVKPSNQRLIITPDTDILTQDEGKQVMGWYKRLRQKRGGDTALLRKLENVYDKKD